MEKRYTKSQVKQIVEAALIKENFKARKLVKLAKAKAFVPAGSGKWKADKAINIFNALVRVKVKASEITDDQVEEFSASQAKSRMKKNPEGLCFFIDNRNYLIAVMKGNKHMALRGGKQLYSGQSLDPKSSKKSRNSKEKYNNSSAHIGGNAMSDRTGISSIERMNKKEIYDSSNICIFINVEDSEKIPWQDTNHYNHDFAKTVENEYRKIENSRSKLKSKLVKLKAERREGKLHPGIILAIARFASCEKLVEKAVAKVLKNPNDFKYGSGLDHKVTYGKGQSSRTYTTSLLKLYVEADGSLQSASSNFTKGQSPESDLRDAVNYFEKIEKICKYIIKK